ncbi:uncharacterized protein LOC129794152 [Lutzomyia longipalpis]|uniref:uncharacterized protein LOC129794152 n=1 Tax=Lutzomyia longipalpis TaxID=7200 RepID=UPI0024835908|nr:uncharacterized protein LOC129794152 [Lutzomyia longipalpis]
MPKCTFCKKEVSHELQLPEPRVTVLLKHVMKNYKGGGLCRECYNRGQKLDVTRQKLKKGHAQEKSANAPPEAAKDSREELEDTLMAQRSSPAVVTLSQPSQPSQPSQEQIIQSQLASHPEMGAVPDLPSSDSLEAAPPARLRDRSSESDFSSQERAAPAGEASHLEVVVQIEQQPHGSKKPSETPQESLMAAPRPKNPRLRETLNDTAARNLVQNMQATMNEAGINPNKQPRNSGG